jgi:hypothetical protein
LQAAGTVLLKYMYNGGCRRPPQLPMFEIDRSISKIRGSMQCEWHGVGHCRP